MDFNAVAKSALSPANFVGKIAKLYGNKGELVLRIYNDFDIEEPIWIDYDSISTPFFISSFTPQGSQKAVAVIDGFDSEKLATRLIGRPFYSLTAVVEEEQSELQQFVGYSVKDSTSGLVAQVVGFMDSELNPLLEVSVEVNPNTVYLPFTDDLIESIDDRKRIIKMVLPIDIFEL